MIDYTQLQQYIEDAENIALFIHRSPDGDCIGGGLALGTVLESLGKQVAYFCPTPPGKDFFFLPKVANISTSFDYGTYDLLLCVDSAAPNPMLIAFREGHEEYFSAQTIINIDHHVSNTHYGTHNIVDPTASSVCEMLSEAIEQLYPEYMTPEIATYLLMGLSTDTGHFLYDQNSVRTFTAALYLLKKGADKKSITQALYRSKSFDQLRAIGLLGERMKKEGPIIYSRYTKEDLEVLQLDKEQIEAFLHLMSSIKHDGIFALFKTSGFDLNPMLRCSLRANRDTQDVSKIAAHFGGGGHKAAAGCAVLIEKDRETTMNDMLQQMQNILHTTL